jgi:hypothetical protein
MAGRRVARSLGLFCVCLSALVTALALTLGCGGESLPDPRDAAREYAEAARQGDASALYGMMTSDAQHAYGADGVKKAVQDGKPELAKKGASLAKGPLSTEGTAALTYGDGEAAILELEQGRFFVTSAGTLPAGAATPAQALGELRRALAARSYPALVRTLSKASSAQLEELFSSLVRALEEPDSLDIPVNGDRATVELPEGHTVILRREDGVWRVEEFR